MPCRSAHAALQPAVELRPRSGQDLRRIDLEVIRNPKHEEHEHYLEWCGGWFDPDAFDLDVENMMLGKMV